MVNIYVTSDIHGEFHLFEKMLSHINFTKPDRLIVLGDVLDRGNSPITTLEFIMKNENIELLMGNHEKMFLDFILAKDERDKYFAYHTFINNGGYTTLNEYDKLSLDKQRQIVEYLSGLPLYKIHDNFIFAHAGLNLSGLQNWKDISSIINKQTEEDFLWSRDEFYTRRGIKGYTIIFGHTPTPIIRNQDKNYDFSMWHDDIYRDKIGIDCGATFTEVGGMLGCIRLNDMKEFYIRRVGENFEENR